jgi:hypothetical protein
MSARSATVDRRVRSVIGQLAPHTTVAVSAAPVTPSSSGPISPVQYGGLLAALALKEHDVCHVFTLAGGHIAPILVGCESQSIRVIEVRDEATAVFAADATSRLTGIPGVAIVRHSNRLHWSWQQPRELYVLHRLASS